MEQTYEGIYNRVFDLHITRDPCHYSTDISNSPFKVRHEVINIEITILTGPTSSSGGETNLSVTPTETPPPPISSTTFTASPTVSTGTRSRATLLPPPPSPSADGVRLMNSLDGTNGAVEGSGFAYYASAVDGNKGAQPNDYAVSTNNVYAQWENQNRTGKFTL